MIGKFFKMVNVVFTLALLALIVGVGYLGYQHLIVANDIEIPQWIMVKIYIALFVAGLGILLKVVRRLV